MKSSHLRGLRWLATWGPALFVAGFEFARHHHYSDVPLWLGTLLVLVAILVGAFIFSTVIFGIIDRMQQQLVDRERELAASRAVAGERERIAREMHDGLGQVLGYVNTKVQAAKELLDRGEIAVARSQLQQLEEAAREVYADIREAILGLRTTVSEDRGLIPAISEYLHRYSLQSGIHVDLVTPGHDAVRLSPLVEVQLLRIIQEALANVRKHAGAKQAMVRFVSEDGFLVATIEDDGRGIDNGRQAAAGGPRFGLQTMRERAEAVGGTFVVESAPGRGTTVVVKVPLGQEGAV